MCVYAWAHVQVGARVHGCLRMCARACGDQRLAVGAIFQDLSTLFFETGPTQWLRSLDLGVRVV